MVIKLKHPIVGTWSLSQFSNYTDDKKLQIWDGNLSGTLVYTKNTVCIAINRWRMGEDGKVETFNSFYSGNYKIIDENTVEHYVMQSSDITRVGDSYLRLFKAGKEKLTLEGQGLSGLVKLDWQRLE